MSPNGLASFRFAEIGHLRKGDERILGDSESVLLLGSQGVGGECHGVGQEIWDDAACSEYLGQERTKPGQRKGIDVLGEVDICEFMGVLKSPGAKISGRKFQTNAFVLVQRLNLK